MTDGRQRLDVDIVCVGFGPAIGRFLTTLGQALATQDGGSVLESRAAPGLLLQVVCFERADDVAAGVSGVVTRARATRRSFPWLNPSEFAPSARVAKERLGYLLDPIGASRRSLPRRVIDGVLRAGRGLCRVEDHAVALPFTPGLLRRDDGLVFSLGQFSQWVAGQVMTSGMAQIWPASPAAESLIEDGRVVGIRLMDQGTDLRGEPTAGFVAGMDVRAAGGQTPRQPAPGTPNHVCLKADPGADKHGAGERRCDDAHDGHHDDDGDG